MSTQTMRVVVGAAWLGAAGAALGSGTIVGVGVPPYWSSSTATGVSADGTIVVGRGRDPSQVDHPWRWAAGSGRVDLPTLAFGQSAVVNGVSADGMVAVGSAVDSAGQVRPVRWTLGGIQDLGALAGPWQHEAYAASADGTIIVGVSGQPFRWTAAGGIEDLYALTGGLEVRGMSADGTAYVGQVFAASGVSSNAVRWTASQGFTELGPPSPYWWVYSTALACSTDGSVVVGVRIEDAPMISYSYGIRWTAAGGVRDLGLDYPSGMSARGDVVVGYSNDTSNPEGPYLPDYAAMWTEALGGVRLSDELTALGVNLSGWELTRALGVSADGRVIVGVGLHTGAWGTRSEGWVVTLSEGLPTCYANCDLSTAPPVLNVNDFACFLNRFAAGQSWANCDGSTVAPALNINDFVCFLNRFAAGCG